MIQLKFTRMRLVTLTIVSILIPQIAVAYPVFVRNCNGVMIEAENLKKLRLSSVKAYVHGNYLFPQMQTGIVSNQVAFYFQNPISFRQMEYPILDGPEFQNVVKAMNAAHAKYGIKPIEADELYQVAIYMMLRISQAIRQTTQLFISPSERIQLGDIENFESLLLNNLSVRASFEQARLYALTVQSVMRSERVTELSREYRSALESVAHLPREERRPTVAKYSDLLGEIIVLQLEQAHPELKGPALPNQGQRSNAGTSRAYELWKAMSHVQIGPSSR